MQKKIAFLKSNILKRGGLEKYTLRLADSFAKSGHDVTLLTTDCPDEALSLHPFKVVNLGNRIPLSILQLLRFDRACSRYLAESPHDVVFGMDRNFCLQSHYRAGNGVHAAYLERRRVWDSWLKNQSFAINPLHRLVLQMEKNTFLSPDLKTLFANSNMVKGEILQYYPGIDPAKICVVHNGVEWKELQMPFDEGLTLREKILKQLGLNKDCYQFLFVGNEYERKGLALLLEALASLPERNFQLSVIGNERNPETFILKAKELGLQDHVRFIGAVKEIKVFYSSADCLVIPSLYDPFANVTVEALAMGLYVISSSANGGSEVITSDDIGLVFNNLQDPEELAKCLFEAMNKRPKTPAQASHIRQAVQYLDFTNQIQKIIDKTF